MSSSYINNRKRGRGRKLTGKAELQERKRMVRYCRVRD
jgi:hypothetical protein